MSEWISIENERPEPLRRVLAATDKGVVLVVQQEPRGFRTFDFELCSMDLTVTHWMPLPKAPEVKE